MLLNTLARSPAADRKTKDVDPCELLPLMPLGQGKRVRAAMNRNSRTDDGPDDWNVELKRRLRDIAEEEQPERLLELARILQQLLRRHDLDKG
ncbi:hypothetical protein [Frigidibacter sp. SD6-1]|uniref:hypothetical protein n=1 Tax=Frigidibacter sp. SD6-1 TaxID=3032581 RepID=UPI0024DF9FD6|nr:hypothetical protein [Frigidibacter sp. SD6-1]